MQGTVKETMKAIMKRAVKETRLPIFLLAGMVLFIMNRFCRTNDSDALRFILAPTAWWAHILGGIYFEYLPHQGYVNYFHQFLIAPSCSGSRFMAITFLMLVFSFLPFGERQEEMRGTSRKIGKEYLWFVFSVIFSYVATIFVNGIRIVVSVYLPGALEKRHLLGGWLTSNRLHTLIGTILYFTFLCLLYLLASRIYRKLFLSRSGNRSAPAKTMSAVRQLTPAFWYLLIVLALPFVKRVYHKEWEGFGSYAAVIIAVCMVISAIFARLHRRKVRRES